MWLFSTLGFYSAVEDYRHHDVIIVRARFREDLQRLRKQLQKRRVASRILETPGRDYRYRLTVPRSVWAEVVRDIAMGIDYGNFKQAALTDGDYRRDVGYHQVWSVMKNVAAEP
jgi:hypothetical protein